MTTNVSVYPSAGRDWNHELAAIRRPAALEERFSRLPATLWNHPMAETANLEASDGRKPEAGIIGLQTMMLNRVSVPSHPYSRGFSHHVSASLRRQAWVIDWCAEPLK
jgi:hypothetical protein